MDEELLTLVSRTLDDDDVPVEAVDLPTAKRQCKVTSDDLDDEIAGFVAAAADHAQTFTRRQFIAAEWELQLPCFPCAGRLELPKAPLIEVTSIKYYDSSNALQTWAADQYLTHAPAGDHADPGRVVLAYGCVYPATYARDDAVQIRFQAGYGETPAAVPRTIRAAILIYVAEMHGNRGNATRGVSVVPNNLTAEKLLHPFKVWRRTG